MRIIINVEQVEHPRHIRVRMGWQGSGNDKLAVHNCGIEIYEVIKEGLGACIEGGEMIYEGERR